MNPALIGLLIQFALQYGIPAARDIVALLNKPNPTAEDWNTMFVNAEVNAKKFLEQTEPKL
jgi:hypothetical protein